MAEKNYFTNGPISVPANENHFRQDYDFNGFSFDVVNGIFYSGNRQMNSETEGNISPQKSIAISDQGFLNK